MAAIVWHGVQSHLESQLVESRTLRLRLPSSSKPSPPQPINDLAFNSCFWDSNINKTDTILDKPHFSTTNPNKSTGWSFLEALSNVSQTTKEPSQKETTTYVHPQQNRSSMVLSPKSLELCTENLGNESGTTDIVENNGIDMMLSSLNCGGGNMETREQRQPRQTLAAKKAKTKNFPPPLTTIRGSESLRVRPHREDGRLVIEITKVPPSVPFFQAERTGGRLRLCFLKNHTANSDPEEEEEDDVIEENEPTTNEGFEEDFENEMNEQTQDVEEEEEEVEVEIEEEKKVNDEMRMEKLERPRRCKESGDHENNELLLNWGESLWVATP